MPRKPRKKSSTGEYHVMLRGINKQTIFEDDEDKTRFMQTLMKYKKASGFELYGYCLMDNHVHLLMKEIEECISTSLKRISSSYVYWYNWKYDRCGHLFQERFKSENVENDAYFVTVLRYIHQNPLKAGLAKSVWESNWISFHEYLYKTEIIDIDRGLGLFSDERRTAIARFIEYTLCVNDDQCLDIIAKAGLSDHELREYLRTIGIASNSMLQQMDKKERDVVLAKLKRLEGASIRQISRLTGISKSVVDRVKC